MMLSFMSFGQTDNEEKAYFLGMQAVTLMDEGNIDESIELLKKAMVLDPEKPDYLYEIGYAYFLKGDYKKSIRVFKKVVKYDDADDQCYQMLGNVYDYNGQPQRAIKAYYQGLQKFPNSGRLYYELGVMQNDDETTLQFYEKGIEVEPTYPTNYFAAAKLYLSYTELEVWGMIYGEIFMNIERWTERTVEMSKLLYATYESEIKFTSDTSFSVSFCNNAILSKSTREETNKKTKHPFGLFVYEPTLLLATVGIKTINLKSLNIIRTNFVNIYFEKGFNKEYPNLLFDWHKEMGKRIFGII